MHRPRMNSLRSIVTTGVLATGVLAALLLVAFSNRASAQPVQQRQGQQQVAPQQQAAVTGPTAELKRVIGRVEVLRKGQTQWVAAVIGDRLVEGDDIRAFSGAQVELGMPDTSTVVLAENSRLLLTKMEFDPQTQSRLFLLHLAVGKVRATVAQAALTLARVRQSNFAITTPTAVAAARGTIMWVSTDGGTTTMAVEPESGFSEGTSAGAWRM